MKQEKKIKILVACLIGFLLLIAILSINIPYAKNEKYYEKEPYETTESYYEQEPFFMKGFNGETIIRYIDVKNYRTVIEYRDVEKTRIVYVDCRIWKRIAAGADC